MKLFIAIFFTALAGQVVSAQKIRSQTVKIPAGEISYSKYSDKIYKLIFTPRGYTHNELISDAVIAKPAGMKHPLKNVVVAGDVITFAGEKKMQSLRVFTKDGQAGFRFALSPNEKVFGGGERALPLNRRGHKFNLYNNPWYGYSEGADNLNYSVPFFTTSDGYGLFFDNPSKGYADIGKTDSTILEVGFTSGEINVYVIFGKDYKEILSGYNKLTGTQPLPPRWAMGNLMSRFGYTSEAQAKDILDKMKAEGIPVDAIVFDLFWFGDSIKGTMGNLDWVNKKKWPDPKKMIADFKKDNVHTILITEPFVVKSSTNYNASKNFLAVDSANKPYTIGDFYFGAGGLIDIFRKDAQDWFWSKHRPQMQNGVEAWWGDLGEPEKHPADLYHNLKDLGFNKRLFKADEVHNLYGHTWTKMLYEKYAKEYPKKRLFSLNRSGFAGTQRYGIFPWSGDVSRSWSGLRAQLPVMLGMSMSGIPYAHADAGGFAGGEGDNELYVRWLQFAAFTPIFRPHGTALYSVDTAAFSFPSEAALIAEPYRSYAKQAIDLRYRFLPHNYTLAYQQAVGAKPLVAPLYYYFPADTVAVNIQDEFMWGENILVAPVLQKGLQSGDVYLPGGGWYDLSTNEMKIGKIKESINMERIPVYVKEGSFVSFWQAKNNYYSSTKRYDPDSEVLTVYYPSENKSSGILYSDDGETKGAAGEVLYFEAETKNKIVSIKIATNNKELYNPDNKKSKIVNLLKFGIPTESLEEWLPGQEGLKLKNIESMEKSNADSKLYSIVEVAFTGDTKTIQFKLK